MTTKEAIRQLSIVGIEAALKDGHIPWGALDTEALRHLIAEARRLETERKRCADIADNTIRACITDDERDIATTIRNLILAPSIFDAPDTGGAR